MMENTEKTCVPGGAALKNTGFGYTLSLIDGKYKMIIIYWLAENNVMRHNELKRSIGTISFKTLSVMLKELVADGLIIRKEYPQIPPKVEYSLSERGRSLIPLLNMMCDWGEKNHPSIALNKE
nr:helix-turn-helix domain-containing protein [Seinonella peptonophila]